MFEKSQQPNLFIWKIATESRWNKIWNYFKNHSTRVEHYSTLSKMIWTKCINFLTAVDSDEINVIFVICRNHSIRVRWYLNIWKIKADESDKIKFEYDWKCLNI